MSAPGQLVVSTDVRPITPRDALRMTSLTAAACIPALAGAFFGLAFAVLLLLAVLPTGLYTLLNLKRDGLPPLPGLFVSVGFGVFFGAGLFSWWLDDRHTVVGISREVSIGSAMRFMAAASALICAFVAGERLRQRAVSASPVVRDGTLFRVAQATLGLSVAGALLTVNQLHGWTGAATILTTHNKLDLSRVSGSIGLSLWSVFNLPAFVALGAVAFDGERRRRVRVALLAELALLFYLCVALFGSRLVPTLGAIGVLAARYCLTGRLVRSSTLLAGVVAVLVVSGMVLAQRPVNSGSTAFPRAQLQTLGYGVFDVSLAARAETWYLGPRFRSLPRAKTILASIVPVGGRRSSTLNGERLDVITVAAVGREDQLGRTGFPPSWPTFALIAFGAPVALALALAGGFIAGALTKALMARRNELVALFFGLWVAFVFNDFKGGDLMLDVASESKRWLYLGLVALFLRALKPSTGVARRL